MRRRRFWSEGSTVPDTRGQTTIVLPTYNRAAFLPDAFAAIEAQTDDAWDLVVVDDGSTDDTRGIVAEYARRLGARMRFISQSNQGAYAARNTGLALASGEFVAFYDSDDQWLPHHLEKCAGALRRHPDVDWVYGACRLVDHRTGEVIAPSSFHVNGRPRPFMQLDHAERDGGLRLITDHRARLWMLRHGFYCGLQNSVIRRHLFAAGGFDPASKVVDDQIFAIRASVAGARFAYFDDVHVIYRVHEENSSASSSAMTPQKRREIFEEVVQAYERVLHELPLNRSERRAVHRSLGNQYFWQLGYLASLQPGDRSSALRYFRRGLAHWPWQPRAWKTLAGALLRTG